MLQQLAQHALPFLSNIATRAIPHITRAIHIGRQYLPSTARAVGRMSQGLSKALHIGRQVHKVASAIAPKQVGQLEHHFNDKAISVGGHKVSVGDILEKGSKGLLTASGALNKARTIFGVPESSGIDMNGMDTLGVD